MESNGIHNLPEELIQQILLRLPARCVLRLKLVCKSWFSLISEPQFAKSHFDLAAAPTHRFLVRDFKNRNDHQDKLVDTENDFADAVFNIPRPSPDPSGKIKVDIVGSCRGFLLLIISSPMRFRFMIWNPLTGMEKRFDQVWALTPDLYGLGYDSLKDDYAVVTVTLKRRENQQIHCFSSRTNSWNCIEIGLLYGFSFPFTDEFAQGSFLNGAIHWLVSSFEKKTDVIIAFDVIKRRLSEIPLLHELEVPFCSRYLTILGGCLCLCLYFTTRFTTEIWMMNEYNVKSSWTKTFVFLSRNRPAYFPLCLTKNGHILNKKKNKTILSTRKRVEVLAVHLILARRQSLMPKRNFSNFKFKQEMDDKSQALDDVVMLISFRDFFKGDS